MVLSFLTVTTFKILCVKNIINIVALIGTKGKEKIRNFLQDNGVTFPAPANN